MTKKRFSKRRSESRPSPQGGAPKRPSEEKKSVGFKDRSGKTHSFSRPQHGGGHARPPSKGRPQPHRHERHDLPNRKPPGEVFTAKAIIDKNHKGFGFLIFDSKNYEDTYIPPEKAALLFHGDRVEVTASTSGEIIRIKILEHRFKYLVGKYSPSLNPGKKTGFVIYERKRSREEVFVPDPPADLKPGDWVKAELEFQDSDKQHRGPGITAKIVKNFGAELPATSDVEVIASEFNLLEEHTQDAIKEAEGYRLEVPGKDLEGRTDLRKVPFITIDGETARDFDDAVYVEREGQDYILWVAIADVSHYVHEGTCLDEEAYARATSVYFPERAFHMLPRALSEKLCSLRPNEPRLTMACKMRFNKKGEKTDISLYEAVIQSQRRATYNEIEKEAQENVSNPNWQYAAHLELYKILRKTRSARGSIDFDLPEMEVKVDPEGTPTSITKRGRLDSHRLIEEFMIAANESVTEWILKRHWPFIYRVHGEPSIEALERFRKLAATVGFQFKLDPDQEIHPAVFADLTRQMHGHAAELLLNSALLRSMKQAIYSSTHGGHFGLASDAYTHFTSPIRRYPDLVVHRMLRRVLRAESKSSLKLSEPERKELEDNLAETAEHCSYRERLATDAEREALRLKQTRLLSKHLGDEFEGTIIGMMERGFFVQLDNPFVEGMVSKDSMNDDLYEFNEDRMIFYGRRKKRTFKIGDRVWIQVVRADIEKRQVDFALIDSPTRP